MEVQWECCEGAVGMLWECCGSAVGMLWEGCGTLGLLWGCDGCCGSAVAVGVLGLQRDAVGARWLTRLDGWLAAQGDDFGRKSDGAKEHKTHNGKEHVFK